MVMVNSIKSWEKYENVVWEIVDKVQELLSNLPDSMDKNQVLNKVLDALEWPRGTHNFLFPCVEAVEEREWSISGRSVVAVQDISRWTSVARFWGSITPVSVWVSLPEEIRMWHLMVWKEHTLWARTLRDVDGWDFVNHSCDPTCWIVWHNELRALRDIKKWEEISFDYGTVVWWVDIESLLIQVPEIEEILDEKGVPIIIPECECGSPTCRKIVKWNDWEKLKNDPKYIWFFPHHIQELINES